MALDITSPCPDKPNCVSTLASSDDSHAIEQLTFEGSLEEAQDKLRNILATEYKCELVELDNENWHCVFTSGFMKFKDDVFFSFSDEEAIIDFRSSSRKGYYDFGANRERMEKIRKLFQ